LLVLAAFGTSGCTIQSFMRSSADPARTSPTVPPVIPPVITIRSSTDSVTRPTHSEGRTTSKSISSSKYHLCERNV
jgi:hypothetical protein